LSGVNADSAEGGLMASKVLQETFAFTVALAGEEGTILGSNEKGVLVAEGDASDRNFIGR